jgi:outer membrane protein OmpA-like peptidoglycan-associated protein
MKLEDTIVNQVFYEQSYLYISIQIEEQPYISCPDTVKLNESFQLSADKTYLPSLDIADEDYFWLINGTTRKRGENISHLFAKEGVYEVQLAVIGFDNEAEAQHCVYKTVVCGNPKTVDNDTIDLFTDNPKENKAVNIVFDRNKYANPEDSLAFYTIEIANGQEELFSSDFRLELLDGKYDYKLRYLEEEELFIYYVGEFETITEAHEFWKELRELGLQEAVVRTLLEQKGEISLDDIFVLNNVKFDSDQWKVREDAMPDLNLVVEIMGNLPDITLEINAYTDNTSSEDYNLELSKKRARSIASYLINKGVSASRVSEFGYGESNPIASNDSEQGKELNRRVEFILKTE